ncbi:c-type cytochrome biogenesis protein CcmI [Neorhizobium sp. P12A]|uniref:c-type cytochrome biogenesis protein CcmI n=1 Tax=Neorhizobium sp. P12A TaxID=2268027 RepID=UPI0011EF1E11|nr:c-type cytochrome biogenesis protein CcmI [Neorhizobium sp. P12A]KAA0698118.1 c-type cytochrome biogenesis protein CcmI [Neorhizobium sp. P12A]
MLFWILVAVLTAGVGAVLLYPLLRTAKAADGGRAGEAAVYRDQLRELDRDLTGGLITPEEAAYARAEIGRRLLAVSTAQPVAGKPARASTYRLTQAFIILLLPAIGLCLYLTVGNPGLPSQPLSARVKNPGNDMAVLVAQAERHLAEHPDDGKGWDILAPIYFKSMRVGDAELAYRNAIRLLGPTPERLGGLAETLIAASDGVVTADARQALQQSLSLEPNNPRAEFYLALALEQDGKQADAKNAFVALAKASPAGAPWLPLVNEHIAKNGGTPEIAAANPDAPGNPSADEVATADTMNSGDRQQMIRGMVDSLDAKLRQNPDNFEGWMRLIRSYAVLNDKDRAADALKRGLSAFPADGGQGQQLLALGKELGVATEETQR